MLLSAMKSVSQMKMLLIMARLVSQIIFYVIYDGCKCFVISGLYTSWCKSSTIKMLLYSEMLICVDISYSSLYANDIRQTMLICCQLHVT